MEGVFDLAFDAVGDFVSEFVEDVAGFAFEFFMRHAKLGGDLVEEVAHFGLIVLRFLRFRELLQSSRERDMIVRFMLTPSIVDVPARRVVGMVVISPMEPNLCPTAWDQFVPRMSEVEIEGDCLGIVRWDYPGLPEGQFAYMAGFVSSMEPPAGMEAWELPAAKYAEVGVSGLDAIRSTIGAFHEEWLPTSGFSKGTAPYLELYPESFPQVPDFSLFFSVA